MVEAHLTGVFPRSEQLIQSTRALERGKASQRDVDAAIERDLSALVELQRSAGLDSLVDGQLNWQDLFRPFSELFTGIRLGGLTRWYDNNTFYRKPIVVGELGYDETSLARYFRRDLLPPRVRVKAILPGPFTFAVLAETTIHRPFSDLVDDIAHSLKGVLESLVKMGYSEFQFNEPALASGHPSKQDLSAAKNAFEICSKGLGGRTTLQTFFGDISPIIDVVLDYPVDCVGVDFYATTIESLTDHDFDKQLGCGCVDGRNSLLESPEDLVDFAGDVEERIEPRSVLLCPNCDLDFLPQSVAEKKVRLLAAAKAGTVA